MLFKIAHTDWNAELPFMLQMLAACSAIIWIRTFLLVPCNSLDQDVAVFDQSFIGRRCHTTSNRVVDDDNSEEKEKEATSGQQVTLADLMPSIKSINTWQFTAFYTLLSCRVKSIQGQLQGHAKDFHAKESHEKEKS